MITIDFIIKKWESAPLAIERVGAISICLPKVMRSFPDVIECPEKILDHIIFHELLHYNEPDLSFDADKSFNKQFEIQEMNIERELVETAKTPDGQVVGYYVWKIANRK